MLAVTVGTGALCTPLGVCPARRSWHRAVVLQPGAAAVAPGILTRQRWSLSPFTQATSICTVLGAVALRQRAGDGEALKPPELGLWKRQLV